MTVEDPTLDSANLLDGLDIDIPPGGAGNGHSPAERPQFLGPYQLIQEVGAGAVARVVRARHIHPRYADTSFAVKILHPALSADPEVVALFRHEAYVLSLLKHPNIVQTFEAGSQDGQLFIAMEYIDGRDLDQALARCQRARTPVPLPVAMHILGEVAKALAYAHELADADGRRLNLIHRDVNPANVFLSYNGRVKLGDFGVASVAAGHQSHGNNLFGKPGYFAPEQLAGEPADERSDVYALGVMMFEMLTGTQLFSGASTEDILRANKRGKVPRPSSVNPEIPPELERAALTALERKPADRFGSARDFGQVLATHTPSAIGMSLAVAALMRKVFLPEHMQELQLREGLAGGIVRGSGQVVAICSTDERAQAAFHELLLSRGYRPELCPTADRLAAVAASTNPPSVVVADVSARSFSPAAFVGVMARAGRSVPVVAVSDALAPQWIHYADAIGAVDLLFKPFNIERVLTGVRAAITGAVRVATIETVESSRQLGVRPHLLVVSSDPENAIRLAKGLSERGFEADVSPSPAEALERTEYASYHGVIYDAQQPSPADRLFASQFRSRPAMGLVPVVFLAPPGTHAPFAGVENERGAVRPRTEPTATLGDLFGRLLGDNRLGRVFVRYPVELPVELRYGGRVFDCQSIDLSRGGVMMLCEQMPPMGTEVGVAIKVPGVPVTVEIAGRIMRVDMPTGEGERRAGIGVEFERFSGKGEAALIGFLGTLDPAMLAKRTMILGAPPRVRT